MYTTAIVFLSSAFLKQICAQQQMQVSKQFLLAF